MPPVLVYRAGWQLIKVRAVMLLSLVAFAVAAWYGADLARTYGLRPADGGELAPLATRIAVGGLVASLGAAFAVGMWAYGRQYAARIALDPAKKQAHLYTVGFFRDRPHVIALSDVIGSKDHEAPERGGVEQVLESVTGGPSRAVYAPWTAVRIKGWRWPVIIDRQGEVLEPELMQALGRRGR